MALPCSTSRSFSHFLLIPISSTLVLTGSGFSYPLVLGLGFSSLVSVYVNSASVFVLKKYFPSKSLDMYWSSPAYSEVLLGELDNWLYWTVPFSKSAIKSYVYCVGHASKVTVYVTPFNKTPKLDISQSTDWLPSSSVTKDASGAALS